MKLDSFDYLKKLADMEKKRNLVEEIRNLAINSLKDFFDKLNINPNIFEDIYNIEIKIDGLNNNDIAAYFQKNNFIIVNSNILSDYLNAIQKVNSDINLTAIKRQGIVHRILLNIEQDLIHEMLHAKRRETLISNEKDDASDRNAGIEEILTESIADLIIRSGLNPEIDFDRLEVGVTEEKNYKKSDILGANLIRAMKEDLLKWFLTSQNYDYLKEKFTEDYDDLVECAFKIYDGESAMHENNKSFSMANEIINKRRQ